MDQDSAEAVIALERRMAELQGQVERLLSIVEQTRALGALGVLAATVAHELNNMLTPVQGYARSALSRPDDGELARRALQRAADGAERGAQLARSILALAGEGAAEDGNLGEGGLASEAVGESVALSRFALEGSGVEVHVQGDAGVRVGAGHSAMVQILQNLLLNAASAMHGRGGNVWVKWQARPARPSQPGVQPGGDASGEPEVEIVVRDDGPGIPAHVMERLFKPFATAAGRQGHAGGGGGVGTARHGGSGLGLSICKGLVEAVGGRIEVESVVGEGTTFRVVVPGAGQDGRPSTP